MFEQSVRLLELENESRKTSFSSQLLTHMARSQLDALIYMLYELRERPKGNRVIAAWNLATLFYKQPGLCIILLVSSELCNTLVLVSVLVLVQRIVIPK